MRNASSTPAAAPAVSREPGRYAARLLSPWTSWLPFAAVLLALLALVLVPILMQRRVRAAQAELAEAVDPARRWVTELQRAFATAGAALSDYLNTGDARLLDIYREEVAYEERADRALEPLVRRLGPEAFLRYRHLRALEDRWQASVDALTRDTATPAEVVAHNALYNELQIAAAGLDVTIAEEGERQRAGIAAAGRLQVALTGMLVGLALIAAASVAWLVLRLRALAAEAERGRREVADLLERRSRLIRGFTHDVKNPLGAADGHLQLLESGLRGPLAEEQRESVARSRSAIGSAVRIIDELIDLSRAEAGQLEVERRPIDAAAVAREAVEEHRAAAVAAGLTLEPDLPDELPRAVADTRRVRRILGNLLSNAVKYTPAGGRVCVRAEVRAGGRAPGPGRWLAIDVSDTGPGIPEADREAVFQEFSRLARGRGAGIGLATSRTIARILGGDVTLESEVGRGSTFTLWLPIQEAARAPARRAA